MAVRRRILWSFLAALAVSATLVAGGSADSPNATAPTVYVLYAMNCTFSIVDDAGKPITSIAPGSYQIDVRTPIVFGTYPAYQLTSSTDMTACRGFPQFQMTGPGVNITTTMTAGCEAEKTFPATLAPSSTYTVVDNNQPTVAHGSFSTLSTGTPVVPTNVVKTGGTAQTQQSLIGSKNLSVIGTLTGSLSAAGKPLLMTKGKAVTKLKAGRYKFAITDKDPKGSFQILGPKNTSATNLTGVKFVGKHSATITLKAGRWTYYANAASLHSFVVG
ncbi:MAG TPA: hypothetical protein VGM80_15195 [Gaiellaceae bacterium]